MNITTGSKTTIDVHDTSRLEIGNEIEYEQGKNHYRVLTIVDDKDNQVEIRLYSNNPIPVVNRNEYTLEVSPINMVIQEDNR
tara:strand:+ start:92 stop:337 length:246 start_codon:yes stop_codon:yes gene_type:complete